MAEHVRFLGALVHEEEVPVLKVFLANRFSEDILFEHQKESWGRYNGGFWVRTTGKHRIVGLCFSWLTADKGLPEEIAELKALRDLHLMGGGISLPDWLFAIKNLWRLKIYRDANLIALSEAISTSNVRELTLASCEKVMRLPDNLGQMQHLRELSLENVPLESLPQSIGSCACLKKLYVASTSLKNLPRSIGNLKSLEVLRLENNPLKSVPREVGKCTALLDMDLSANRIASLPAEFGRMGKTQPKELHPKLAEIAKVVWERHERKEREVREFSEAMD